MSKHHGRLKRYAVTGLTAATLTLSLLLPATALADPITVDLNNDQLALQANLSKSWQSAYQKAETENSAHQSADVHQSQPNFQKSDTENKAYQKADLQPESVAAIDTYSGDAKAYGPSTSIGILNWQNADASAKGAAFAYSDTGNANGYTGDAYANGGKIDQENDAETGNGGDAKSVAVSTTIDPAKANGGFVKSEDNGNAYSSAKCAVGDGNESDWECTKGSDAKSFAKGGDTNSSADGGGATSNGSSSATASSTGGNSGNNGDQSNTATGANGGNATNVAYGGNTGRNSTTAVIAGGTAANALTVDAKTIGDATATSGDASNTGAATSSATATSTQSANPTNTTSLTNTPTQTSDLVQKALQKAQTDQSSENEVDQSNFAKNAPNTSDN